MSATGDAAPPAAARARLPLGDAVRLARRDATTFAGSLDPTWWGPVGAHGGYLGGVLLDAFGAVVADCGHPGELRPRNLTLGFVAPVVAADDCTLTVRLTRASRTVVTCDAEVRHAGELCVIASAVYGSPRPSLVTVDHHPPAVAPPQDCPPWWSAMWEGVPVMSRYEGRIVDADPPFSGSPHRRSQGWLRLVDPTPPSAATTFFFADAWIPPLFAQLPEPVASAPSLELSVFFTPDGSDPAADAGDWALVDVTTDAYEEGYVLETGRVLDQKGRVLCHLRQIAVMIPVSS